MGQDLIGQQISAYPETAAAWRSPVWEFLDADLPDITCANRLYEELERSRTTTRLEDLLKGIVTKGLPALGGDLEEISRLVLALRVARKANLSAIAVDLAGDLAKGLLLLSGCVYRRAAAEQIWRYCGHTWLKGLKSQSQGVFFEDRTWEFIERHAIRALLRVRMLAYSSPQAKVLPFPFVEELLGEIVTCVTTRDADHASFVMGRLYSFATFDDSTQAMPDVEKLSIWQPF